MIAKYSEISERAEIIKIYRMYQDLQILYLNISVIFQSEVKFCFQKINYYLERLAIVDKQYVHVVYETPFVKYKITRRARNSLALLLVLVMTLWKKKQTQMCVSQECVLLICVILRKVIFTRFLSVSKFSSVAEIIRIHVGIHSDFLIVRLKRFPNLSVRSEILLSKT